MSTDITSLAALRELDPEPVGRAVLKQLSELDVHCERFIALSPFVVLATSGADGKAVLSIDPADVAACTDERRGRRW
jgi:hypothetical protein